MAGRVVGTVKPVSDRSGCSPIELAGLLAVHMCEPNPADAKTTACPEDYGGGDRVVALVEALTGLGARHAWELLLDLARPWVIAVPLVKTRGHIGARPGPKEASTPERVGCRLSRAGRVVLAAEAGHLAPVPAGIVNGTIWRGGLQPSMAPARVISALHHLLDHTDMSDQDLLASVGPPCSLTDCDISGDLDALAAGKRIMLRQTGRIRLTGNPIPKLSAHVERGARSITRCVVSPQHWTERAETQAQLIIESLPDRDDEELTTYLNSVRVPQDRPLPEGDASSNPDRLLVADVADISGAGGPVRLAIRLAPGSDAVAARDKLLSHDSVTSAAPAAYPVPLATLLRAWVSQHSHENLADSLTRFADGIRQDRE